MDFDALRAQFAAAVPFARHAGVEIVEIGDGTAQTRLTQTEQLSNHIGSLHAGAIFTLAEAASGAAMVGAFAEMAAAIRPLATEARISYLKLGRGAVTAQAKTDHIGADLRHQLRATGLVTFQVTVDVLDERQRIIAQVVVGWRVSMPKLTAS